MLLGHNEAVYHVVLHCRRCFNKGY